MSFDVALVVLSVGVTALFLVFGVNRTLRTTGRTARMADALTYIDVGELSDVDTTLAKDRRESTSGWWPFWYRKVTRAGRVAATPRSPGNVAFAGLLGATSFGFLVFPGGVFGGILLPAVLLGIVSAWLGTEARKRTATMERQLPQLLSGLRANLQTGSTPQQAIIAVADDLPAPLGDELRLVKRDINVAVPLDIALKQLSNRVPSREMQFLASSIEIAVRSGADLDPQLATIEKVVQQRTRLRQKLATAVASVRPTQIAAMAAVPVFFFNSWQNPENQTYWMSPEGIPALFGVAVFTLLGVWGLRLLVKRVENT